MPSDHHSRISATKRRKHCKEKYEMQFEEEIGTKKFRVGAQVDEKLKGLMLKGIKRMVTSRQDHSQLTLQTRKRKGLKDFLS